MKKRKNQKATIEPGMVFHRWTVIGEPVVGKNGEKRVLCQCSCGTQNYVLERSLLYGGSKSCGCLRRERISQKNTKDLTGMTFGDLKVIGIADRKQNASGVFWTCQCACGTVSDIPSALLLTGRRTNCGGPQHKKAYRAVDITGQTFGELTALEPTDQRDAKGSVIWKCRCSCGKEVNVSYNHLLYSNLKSCGCLNRKHKQEINGYLTHVAGTSIDCVKSKKIPSDNTTGYRGVYFVRGKYLAKIVFQQKAYYLGTYDHIEDAAAARKEAEHDLFDEVALYYEKWKQRAEQDVKWAEENPVDIQVKKDENGYLKVRFQPVL